MSQEATINQVLKYPVVPVFYNADYEVSKNVASACYAGGIRIFEFTNRGKNALEIFTKLKEEFKQKEDFVFGAGTIMTDREAQAFIDAGASFIVSPCFVESVADTCYQYKIPYMPGCMTVKEIHIAMQAGCEVLKVFPGEVLGMPFVKAVKAVFPTAKLMVTGGVSPTKDSMVSWFQAGVSAVGMGSQLFKKDWIESGNYQAIEEACSNCFQYLI